MEAPTTTPLPTPVEISPTPPPTIEVASPMPSPLPATIIPEPSIEASPTQQPQIEWVLFDTTYASFELPSEWYRSEPGTGSRQTFYNIEPPDHPLTAAELGVGVMKLDYAEEPYGHTPPNAPDFEELTVYGYPARLWVARTDGPAASEGVYALVVEAPQRWYQLSLWCWLGSEKDEAQETAFYDQCEQIMRHIIETLEVY